MIVCLILIFRTVPGGNAILGVVVYDINGDGGGGGVH